MPTSTTPALCPAFLEVGGSTFRCIFPAGHPRQHTGYGARGITYAVGLAPQMSWLDTTPGANGNFRPAPDDLSGKTPYDGQQVVPGDSAVEPPA